MHHLLAVALLLSASASFAGDPLAVVVLPPLPLAGVDLPPGLPLAMQERTNARLLAAPGLAVVHPRQVAAMASRHRMKPADLADPVGARTAAERVGATVFVASTLSKGKDGVALEATVSRVGTPASQSKTVTLPADAAKAVALVEQTIAELVLANAGVKAPPLTLTAEPTDASLKAYAQCVELLGQQPLGIENPSVLKEDVLAKAVENCRGAVKASPAYADAWAALALANAVSGQDEAAVAAVNKTLALKAKHHLPNLVLARFWLASRYQSGDAAVKVLEAAVAAEPGFLLARVYLAELLNALGRHELAAKAWRDYAGATRNHPFVMSRLGYTLARLGQQAEAAAFAEKALAFDRESVELSLELASRYVDAGQLDKAIAVLEPLAAAKDARAEVLVRLGFARLSKGDVDGAEKHLTRAIAAATEPSEWRAKARAKLNLGAVALKRGKKDDARRLVTEAAKEGLTLVATPETKDVLALFTADELGKLKGTPAARLTSPFPLSGGDADPSAKRAAAPKGLDGK